MSALIVIEVHARDVVIDMFADGVSRVSDFEWIKQLRYYWEEDDFNEKNVRVKFLFILERRSCDLDKNCK